MSASQLTRAVALLAAVELAACAPRAPATAPAPASQTLRVVHGHAAGIARARADSARLPYTAADVHFMSGMIGHHAQAIVMAKWVPTHGGSPAIHRLAERIVNAQEDEIVLMQQWLADRLKPVPEPDPAGMKMTMDGGEHMHLMPGMLNSAQMKQLDQARGEEFDRLFLIFMIQHHRGAVEMVKELFGTTGAGQDDVVFKFASDVNVDQSTEIARMERMLEALIP